MYAEGLHWCERNSLQARLLRHFLSLLVLNSKNDIAGSSPEAITDRHAFTAQWGGGVGEMSNLKK